MAEQNYDLIVVGGGIHGLMIGLTACEDGHRTLLVERGALASGATGGWFRILHGGLRYLQSLGIARFRASLRDSRWFLREFPELVERQPFLMPLYGHGLKRPAVFRTAFLVEKLLGIDRNFGVPEGKEILRGRVIGPDAVAEIFPAVRREGLQGGALWEELVVPDSAALITALADRARRAGLVIVEHCPMTRLLSDGRRVTGIAAGSRNFGAPRVILAAGTATAALARTADPRCTAPFGHPARAFNLRIDRPFCADAGLSLAVPGEAEGGMIFAYPDGRTTFLGTDYVPAGESRPGDPDEGVSGAQIRSFLERCNAALPGLAATENEVLSVTQGCLPAVEAGSVRLLERDVIHDHGRAGGPEGLVSLSAVKFTTAPGVARRVLRRAFPSK